MKKHLQKQGALRAGFTLFELLIVVAVVGVLATITVIALNPNRQLTGVQDAKRKSNSQQIENALAQYQIDTGRLPGTVTLSEGETNAVKICQQNALPSSTCIDVGDIVPKYISVLQTDPAERCSNVSGYKAWLDHGRPKVKSELLGVSAGVGNADECTATIVWEGTDWASNGSISGGTYTATAAFTLPEEFTFTIATDGILDLNGYDFTATNATLVNNGSIIAKGSETCTATGNLGSWILKGGGADNDTCLSGKTVKSLTLNFATSSTFAPTSAVTITENLVVGASSVLSTENAEVFVTGTVTNLGAIILGDTNSVFSSGMDNSHGQTIIRGTAVPTLNYYDLVIDADTSLLSDVSVYGTLTINADVTFVVDYMLTMYGNGMVYGTLRGSGTVYFAGSNQTLTVAPGGEIRGHNEGQQLILDPPQPWNLVVQGTDPFTLLYVKLEYANVNRAITCNYCVDLGNNTGAAVTYDSAAIACPNGDSDCAINDNYWCGQDVICHNTCTQGVSAPECTVIAPICDTNVCYSGNCVADGDCSAGYPCVSYYCQYDCRDFGCASGYDCNQSDGTCSFSSCASDDDCASGQYCDGNGACLDGCRGDNGDSACTGDTPYCDTTSRLCAECWSDNTDCSYREDGTVCDTATDSCVQCIDNTPCSPYSCDMGTCNASCYWWDNAKCDAGYSCVDGSACADPCSIDDTQCGCANASICCTDDTQCGCANASICCTDDTQCGCANEDPCNCDDTQCGCANASYCCSDDTQCGCVNESFCACNPTDPSCSACPTDDIGSTVPQTVYGDTTGYNNVYQAGSDWDFGGSGDRTYIFTAPQAGTFRFSLTASYYYNMLYVYDSYCSGTRVGYYGQYYPNSSNVVDVALSYGQQITIVVDGAYGYVGSYSLDISIVDPCTIDDTQCGCANASYCCTDDTQCGCANASICCTDDTQCGCANASYCCSDDTQCGCANASYCCTDDTQCGCVNENFCACNPTDPSCDPCNGVNCGAYICVDGGCPTDCYSGWGHESYCNTGYECANGWNCTEIPPNPCDTNSCDNSGCAGWTCDCNNSCDPCYGVSCDDGSNCTSDYCSGGDCYTSPQNDWGSCDDSNGCTTGEYCYNGGCGSGSGVSCEDYNACTSDSCDPSTGCHNDAVSCDDSNACTSDSCDGAGCRSDAVNCDDSNYCTDDGCDTSTGCYNNWNSETCP